jgi:hypothetical protein
LAAQQVAAPSEAAVSASLNLGDVVAIETRALGELKKLYDHLQASDTFTVTRLDRSRGKQAAYLRKVGAEHRVVVAWPENLKVVRRAARPPRRKS